MCIYSLRKHLRCGRAGGTNMHLYCSFSHVRPHTQTDKGTSNQSPSVHHTAIQATPTQLTKFFVRKYQGRVSTSALEILTSPNSLEDTHTHSAA